MATEEVAVLTQSYSKYLTLLGGRKFILTMLSMGIISVMRFTDYLDQPTFQILFMATVGVYVAGNVTQKATAKNPTTVVSTTPQIAAMRATPLEVHPNV